MLRYAVAQLYNPQSCTVAGLKPSHFITLATPHLGCDAEGVAQARGTLTIKGIINGYSNGYSNALHSVYTKIVSKRLKTTAP
jgi:hypothetical protein